MAQIHTIVPDDIYQRLKIICIRQDRTIKLLVAEIIEAAVERLEKKAGRDVA